MALGRKKQDSGAAAAGGTPAVGRMEKLRQIWMAFKLTRQRDPMLPLFMLAAFVLVAGVVEVIGILLGHVFFYLIFAVMLGFLAAIMVFGRRAQKAAFSQVEGQPGAAYWVLQGMRGDWRLTPGVAATAQLDSVHRVLGKPGVILVAEGTPRRVRSLLAQEKKRVARVAGDVPIYDIVVGDGEDEVPVRKLSAHLMKLPRNVESKQLSALEKRLSALTSPTAGMPKGPMPAKAQRGINERTIRRR